MALKKPHAGIIERTLMFNLEHSIAQWRQEMVAAGIKNPAVLDELESHLQEEVERQKQSGIVEEQIFRQAVEKIGTPRELRKEFKKSSSAAWMEKLMIAIAVLWVAFGVFLSTVTLFFCYLTTAQRLTGALGMALTILTGCAWPALVPHLPVIAKKTSRWAAQLACLVAGFGLCTLYVQVLVHRFEDGSNNGIVPSIGFFGLFFIALGFGVACGLERAASFHRRIPA